MKNGNLTKVIFILIIAKRHIHETINSNQSVESVPREME